MWGKGIARAGLLPSALRLERVVKRTIEEALRKHTAEWMSIPGVVGTAQGMDGGKPCIKVYAAGQKPELDRRIPKAVEGYAVIVEATGAIRPRE